MAINEACQVWIEQRISEELAVPEADRKSHRAIAKEIAQEIERIFETRMKPETVRSRVRKIAMVNLPTQSSTESANEIQDRATGKKKGGKREGAGKKSKSKVNKYEQVMIKTHALFHEQVAIARRNSWKYVSVEMIKQMLLNTASLIEN